MASLSKKNILPSPFNFLNWKIERLGILSLPLCWTLKVLYRLTFFLQTLDAMENILCEIFGRYLCLPSKEDIFRYRIVDRPPFLRKIAAVGCSPWWSIIQRLNRRSERFRRDLSVLWNTWHENGFSAKKGSRSGRLWINSKNSNG